MLIIKPKNEIASDVEWPSCVSAMLVQQKRDELLDVLVSVGRAQVRFGDLFAIDASDQNDKDETLIVRMEGNFSRVHGIGREWSSRPLEVEGGVGDCLGEQMSGGRIVASSDAGDCMGRGMSGGLIEILGDAGDYVASNPPGTVRGMTGGSISVRGDVGRFCGYRLRRGTIVVHGNSAEHLAEQMLAGTILVHGRTTGPVAVGMKRGTVVLFNEDEVLDTPHLNFATQYAPTFMQALFEWLNGHQLLPADFAAPQQFSRYLGDMTCGQRGEVLVAISAN